MARDKKGATQSGTLLALDRNAALHELRSQGMVTLSLVENQRGIVPRQNNQLFERIIVAVAAVSLVIIGLMVWWWLQGHPKGVQSTSNRPLKKSMEAKTTKVKSLSQKQMKPGDFQAVAPTQLVEEVTRERPVKTSRAPSPHKAPEPTVKMVEWPTNEITRVFEREIEFRMAQYINAGQRPSPPPPMIQTNLEEMAKDALSKNIVVQDNDTESIYATKENVAKMKEALRQYMAQGGTASEFFKGLADRQKTEADLAMEARSIITELTKQGKIEEAKTALTEINSYLKSQGQPDVVVPPPYRKVLDIPPRVESQ